MEQARAQGPILLVDVGNALYRAPGMGDPLSQQKAALVMSAMGRLGTFAMAVGARDLAGGVPALRTLADAAGVKLLSANLAGPDGKLLFASSAVTQVGKVKVGLIGVSPPGPAVDAKGVKGLPVLPAVAAQAKALRGKTDLVVLLAAVPYADALQLSAGLADSVDLVLNAHEGRGAGTAQRAERNFVIPAGERGRQLGRLDLELGGKGGFTDLDEVAREAQLVTMITHQLAQLQGRLAAAKDPKAKQDLEAAMAGLKASKQQHEKAAAVGTGGGRTLKLSWVGLGPEVKDDPALRLEVEKLEPPAAH